MSKLNQKNIKRSREQFINEMFRNTARGWCEGDGEVFKWLEEDPTLVEKFNRESVPVKRLLENSLASQMAFVLAKIQGGISSGKIIGVDLDNKLFDEYDKLMYYVDRYRDENYAKSKRDKYNNLIAEALNNLEEDAKNIYLMDLPNAVFTTESNMLLAFSKIPAIKDALKDGLADKVHQADCSVYVFDGRDMLRSLYKYLLNHGYSYEQLLHYHKPKTDYINFDCFKDALDKEYKIYKSQQGSDFVHKKIEELKSTDANIIRIMDELSDKNIENSGLSREDLKFYNKTLANLKEYSEFAKGKIKISQLSKSILLDKRFYSMLKLVIKKNAISTANRIAESCNYTHEKEIIKQMQIYDLKIKELKKRIAELELKERKPKLISVATSYKS